MKKTNLFRMAFFICMIAIFLSGTALALSLSEIEANLDPEKNTKVAIKEYWRSIEGTEVKWSGTVDNVKGGRNRYKVYVRVNGRRPNVVFVTTDEQAASLKKGQTIRFSGKLSNFRHLLGKLTIELTEGEILK